MVIHMKMTNDGKLFDVKVVDDDRKSRSTYYRNYYYAKSKRLCKCEYCGKMLNSASSLGRHYKSKKCIKAQMTKPQAMVVDEVDALADQLMRQWNFS